MQQLPRDLRADKEFMTKVVSESGSMLEYADAALRADVDVVQAAVESNHLPRYLWLGKALERR